MEPLGPHVHRRAAAIAVLRAPADGRLAAAAAATVLALSGTGDAIFLAVLLGLAAADVWTGATATAVAVSLLIRHGTTSLTAVAGAQAVLGPSGLSGPALAAAASWCGGLALLVVAPPAPLGVAFGVAAGVVVAGPAAGTPAGLLVRLGAAVAGGAVAAGISRVRIEQFPRRLVGWAAGVASVALALAAR